LNDIKSIVEEVQRMTIDFDLSYDQGYVAELLYDVDMSMRAILEIINGPSGKIEKMIDSTDKELRCNSCSRTIDSYFYRYFCKTCYDRGTR
jgi:hypothetical protein